MKKIELQWYSTTNLKHAHLPNLTQDEEGAWMVDPEHCLCGFPVSDKLSKSSFNKPFCHKCSTIIKSDTHRAYLARTYGLELVATTESGVKA
jgi:hypothetical protein